METPSRGAHEMPHPGGTLLAHLKRVHALLAEWGARPVVRLAGLCHAYYGTDGFPAALGDIAQREELAAMIGEEAERLVYFYASCDRRFSYPHLGEPEGPFMDRFTGTDRRSRSLACADLARLRSGCRWIGAVGGSAQHADRPRSCRPGIRVNLSRSDAARFRQGIDDGPLRGAMPGMKLGRPAAGKPIRIS